ncbi:MAG: diacylglycerol kinase family protein [Microbacteriaceae bacterium]|nr:diacylglycerol kinase family protein [Microbacteriaceae bacterium]
MSSSQTRQHVAVVYQPLKTDLKKLRSAVAAQESIYDFAPTKWYETSAEDSGVAATEQAMKEGAVAVLASGGDGTVRVVASVLRHTGVPLAIVPQGTGNLLARNIGAPLKNLPELVAAAFAGQRRTIDLGSARIIDEKARSQEAVFLVLAGIGLDAQMIASTNDDLKKKLGWLAYVDAGVRTMFKIKPLRVLFACDDEKSRVRRFYGLMVGNCGTLQGGIQLMPDARIDDQLLDVVALRPVSKLAFFSWLSIFWRVLWDNGVLRKLRGKKKKSTRPKKAGSVVHKQVAKLRFYLRSPESLQLDGDDFGLVRRVETQVDPGAIVLCTLPHWKPEIPPFSKAPNEPAG